MPQHLGLVSIVVRDYDEAIAFYVGTLGFLLVEDTHLPEPGKRWVGAAASVLCPQPRQLRSGKHPVPIPETTQPWRPDAEITARSQPMSLGQRSEWLGQPCGGSENIRVNASN
jgi:catechol 2,3-dioxygenase-like lactoylglutathione lyase family enzyme